VFGIKAAAFEAALVLSKKNMFALCKLGKCPTAWLDSHWGYVAKIQSTYSMFGSALEMIGSYYSLCHCSGSFSQCCQILVIGLDLL